MLVLTFITLMYRGLASKLWRETRSVRAEKVDELNLTPDRAIEPSVKAALISQRWMTQSDSAKMSFKDTFLDLTVAWKTLQPRSPQSRSSSEAFPAWFQHHTREKHISFKTFRAEWQSTITLSGWEQFNSGDPHPQSDSQINVILKSRGVTAATLSKAGLTLYFFKEKTW